MEPCFKLLATTIKQFSRWLVRDRRMPDDPLAHLAMQNVKTDRRHDRRALSADELSRLMTRLRTALRSSVSQVPTGR